MLQRKRAKIADKKRRIAKKQADAAEYQKLLAQRLKEKGSAEARAWPRGGPSSLPLPRPRLPHQPKECPDAFRCFKKHPPPLIRFL